MSISTNPKADVSIYHLNTAICDVREELLNAISKFPPMRSAHEGYAIILEELDELWEEVRSKQGDRNTVLLYAEAKQVAAMAIRFMMDICLENKEQI